MVAGRVELAAAFTRRGLDAIRTSARYYGTRRDAHAHNRPSSITMGSTDKLRAGTPGPFDVHSVAIIGAGPSGLASAKYLLAQRGGPDGACPFTNITIFEQQPQVGGVWLYSDAPTPTQHIPQTSAFCPPDGPLRRDAEGEAPVFPSPMYDSLNTNIPHTLMQYSDAPFITEGDVREGGRDRIPIFPSRQTVQAYLERYAADVRHLIRFSTTVEDVRLVQVEQQQQEGGATTTTRDRWDVTTRDVRTGAARTERFDAVVVASGHYSTTYTPDVPGIREFAAAHPGALAHAKSYRRPEDGDGRQYVGKKVVVVGNGPSGLDIASQIARVARPPLLLAAQSPTPADAPAQPAPGVEEVAPIAAFEPARRAVRLADGREVPDVDAVLFCTGYLFSFPFLARAGLEPAPVTDHDGGDGEYFRYLDAEQHNNKVEREGKAAEGGEKTTLGGAGATTEPGAGAGRRVRGLYRHFLHIGHPTLVFPGLPIKVIPFPVAEAQAAVFARLWANALPALPPAAEMAAWERREAAERGALRFHVFPRGGDGEYVNALHDWAAQADTGGPTGKAPPYWDGEMKWRRSIYGEAKAAFERTGKTARTLEELGFRYEPGTGAE